MPTNRHAGTYTKQPTTAAQRARTRKAFRAATLAEEAAKRNADRDATVAALAATLGLGTLETLDSDREDFRTVAVWTLKSALELAYAAGKASK